MVNIRSDREQSSHNGAAGRAVREADKRARREKKRVEEREQEKQERQAKEKEQHATQALAALRRSQGAAVRQAAREGDLNQFLRLKAEGHPIDMPDAKGLTALHMAALGNHPDTIIALLDAGIDIDVQDNRGRTAVAMTAEQGHTDALCALVDDGADLERAAHATDLAWTPIMFAAANGHEDVIGAHSGIPRSFEMLFC